MPQSFFKKFPAIAQAETLMRGMPTKERLLDISHVAELGAEQRRLLLPEEILLVVPKLSLIASFAEDCPPDWPLYNRALRWMMTWLSSCKSYGFEDNLADRSVGMDHGPRFFHLHSATDGAYQTLEERQPGNFMVLRVHIGGEGQTGLSPHEAHGRIIDAGRFPLEPIALLSMLYIHKAASNHSDKVLWLDALGITASPKGNGVYDDSAYLDCRGQLVNVDWNWAKRRRSFRLAVSAAMP